MPSCLVYAGLGVEARALCMLAQHLTSGLLSLALVLNLNLRMLMFNLCMHAGGER